MRIILQIFLLVVPSFAYALPGLDDIKSMNPLGGGEINFSESKTELTELFFKSSNHYLQSQELLLKAYNKDAEAQIVREAIEYANNSKNSEADRMKNSIKVTTEASNILKNSINLETDKISAEGTIMYNNALIPAGKGIISTIKLVPVSVDMAQRLANPVSAVTLITELGGLVEIIPNIPSYISTMVLTMKLVVTGAKANNIEGANDLEANLGELIL